MQFQVKGKVFQSEHEMFSLPSGTFALWDPQVKEAQGKRIPADGCARTPEEGN
jgi:hypothetical protein